MKNLPVLPMALLATVTTLPPLSARAPETLELAIDTTEAGAPISPYIYGQFIEHLGRCIYGGIWAEMLEDRKFYFPITEEYAPYRELTDAAYPVVGASPWEIVSDPAGVVMVTEDSFVGEQTPRLAPGAAIRQNDLGVRANLVHEGYLWAKPVDGVSEIEVRLRWGPGPSDSEAMVLRFSGTDYERIPYHFTPTATTERGASLEVRVRAGAALIGTLSLMPGDHVNGMRRDTLALLKQLNGTVYRWPGGNFVSGYDWRDGIGDRDRRPPRKNPAWTGVEHNDFGTDEFIAFCRAIGTEPMIAVNTGLGGAYSAAQWVEYCNGTADTLAGGWRKDNGNRDPYDVQYWCVGNEMFGTWQLGWMQLNHYIIKHNLVAEAMWGVDPDIDLVAVGDLTGVNKDNDPAQVARGVTWSEGMLMDCADHMTMLSEHFYSGRVPWTEDGRADTIAHVALLRDSIREKAEGHRELQARLENLDGRIVPIAMDEWNYWHREYEYGELGCIYDLQDGLGVAAGLHEYFRQSDIVHMAHYAQTVNVIGAIKTTRIAAEMETTGLVLQMYRAHYGTVPAAIGEVPEPYDIVAALSADGATLTLAVVNPTTSGILLEPKVSGVAVAGPGTRWHVGGSDSAMHNAPGKPRVIDIEETVAVDASAGLEVPPLSCAVFAFPVAR